MAQLRQRDDALRPINVTAISVGIVAAQG